MEQQHNTFNAGLAFSDFKQRQFFYILAAAVAFAMSSYFVVGYLAGNLLPWTWDSGQWMNGFVGIGITAVMTSYQFFLYSQGDVEGGKKATLIAVCVAVGFSLLSEVGQGMERDTIRMETKSQESPAYKAIVGALSGSAGASYNPYSADLQAAEKKLARCNEIKAERLAKGKEYDCIESQAGVDAVNQMIANADRQSQSKALALAQTAKTMERDEKNYHPLVNLIRETFNATGTVGSFLLSLTLISFFEYAFHYLGGAYAKAREKLMRNGYDVTRKLRQPPRKHDGSISTYSDNSPALSALDSAKMTVGEYAQKVEEGLQAAPEVIATEYARAQHAREQVYSKAADKLDDIQDGLNEREKDIQLERYYKLLYTESYTRVLNGSAELTVDSIFNVVTDVLRQHTRALGLSPALVGEPARRQLAESILKKMLERGIEGQIKLHQEKMKTYRQELAEGEKAYSDSPLDKPRPAPRLSVADTVKQIQADVKANGATSPEAVQAAVFDSFAAIQNPAPLNDVALNRIADKLADNRAHTTAPALPSNQKAGGTGLQNPALGSEEEHYPLPLDNERAHSGNEQVYVHPTNERAHSGNEQVYVHPTNERAHSGNEQVYVHPTNERAHSGNEQVYVHPTNERAHSGNEQVYVHPTNERAHSGNEQVYVHPTNERAHSGNEQVYVHPTNERAHSVDRELLVALKDAQGKIDADVLKEGYGLYEQWKAEVLAGNTKLTTRDGRSFISAHLCRGKKRTITPDGMNALLEVWQVRAVKEAALVLNPKYTGKPPFPKYLLAA